MGAFVYMLRCSDKSYYVGSATGDDLLKRFEEHQTGAYRGYTYLRRPVELSGRSISIGSPMPLRRSVSSKGGAGPRRKR